eukprot:m.355248 g.355248  ORF g.355248 m.355248 type:complete len:68 (+) comp77842_c0_seq1:179-382(+)
MQRLLQTLNEKEIHNTIIVIMDNAKYTKIKRKMYGRKTDCKMHVEKDIFCLQNQIPRAFYGTSLIKS